MRTGKALSIPVVRVALGVALVLSVPLVAMLASDGVVWSLCRYCPEPSPGTWT